MKFYKYSMNMVLLNVLCVVLFIPMYILICYMGINSYIDYKFLIICFFWMILHELLHGIGFSFSKGINHKNIVYGANLEKGIFYCMCKQRISKKNIMISLLFPFTFIGIFTLIIGLFFDFPILINLSFFNIAGCIGDIVMFVSFLRLPYFEYIDLDDCTGFVLVSSNDLSKYKLLGLKLVDCGDYTDSMIANDYRKLTITKLSYFIFMFLILLFFIEMII